MKHILLLNFGKIQLLHMGPPHSSRRKITLLAMPKSGSLLSMEETIEAVLILLMPTLLDKLQLVNRSRSRNAPLPEVGKRCVCLII